MIKLKSRTRILILAAVAVLVLFSGFLIYKGFGISERTDGETYSYNITRNSDYKVYLVENSHYDAPYLSPKDNPDIEQYASSLIDYIDVDFNYNYSQSTIKNFYNTYSVKATITGQYENAKSSSAGDLWKRNYILLNDTDVASENTSTYNIRQNVKINYGSYSAEVNQYRAATHLAIDAELTVVMQINSYDTPFDSPQFDRSKPVFTDQVMLKIPLTASATRVEQGYEKTSTGVVTPEHETSTNGVMITAGIISVIITATTFVVLFRIFFKDERTGYEKQLDKILKNYSDIIADVEGGKVTDKAFVDIKNFEDLVDIEEELKSPILHYEIDPGKESWFIIKGDPVYRYILKKAPISRRQGRVS